MDRIAVLDAACQSEAREERKSTPIFRLMAAAFACVMGIAVAPAVAQAPDFAPLESLQKGEWEIRFRDGSPTKRICVRSGLELIQLRHQGQTCGRYSAEPEQDEVTIQYSCRAKGYGRTNLRMETEKLVQLESHGVADGLPFHFSAEARHVGACS